MNPNTPLHPEPDALEAWAAGELVADTPDAQALEAHLGVCARCAATVEGWQTVFASLRRLPEAHPSEGFAARVMAEVHASALSPHLDPDRLFDLLDGALPVAARVAAEAHLEACGSCRTLRNEWLELFHGIAALEPVAPSPGFSNAVLTRFKTEAGAEAPSKARVQLATASPVSSGLRTLRALAARWAPQTPRGWAVAGGLFAAPAAGIAVAVGFLLAQPLVTPGGLIRFAVWQLAEVLSNALAGLGTALVANPLAYALWALVDGLKGQSLILLGGGAGALSIAVAAASVVLYRNLIVLTPRTSGHV
jgi:anti-sigma factor RsiW